MTGSSNSPVSSSSKVHARRQSSSGVFLKSGHNFRMSTRSSKSGLVTHETQSVPSTVLDTPPSSPSSGLLPSSEFELRKRRSSGISPAGNLHRRTPFLSSFGGTPRRQQATLAAGVIGSKGFDVDSIWVKCGLESVEQPVTDQDIPTPPHEPQDTETFDVWSWPSFESHFALKTECHEYPSTVGVPSTNEAECARDCSQSQRLQLSCSLVNSRVSRHSIEEEKATRTTGKKQLRRTKFKFIVTFFLLNAGLTFLGWNSSQYWLACQLPPVSEYEPPC